MTRSGSEAGLGSRPLVLVCSWYPAVLSVSSLGRFICLLALPAVPMGSLFLARALRPMALRQG